MQWKCKHACKGELDGSHPRAENRNVHEKNNLQDRWMQKSLQHHQQANLWVEHMDWSEGALGLFLSGIRCGAAHSGHIAFQKIQSLYHTSLFSFRVNYSNASKESVLQIKRLPCCGDAKDKNSIPLSMNTRAGRLYERDKKDLAPSGSAHRVQKQQNNGRIRLLFCCPCFERAEILGS